MAARPLRSALRLARSTTALDVASSSVWSGSAEPGEVAGERYSISTPVAFTKRETML